MHMQSFVSQQCLRTCEKFLDWIKTYRTVSNWLQMFYSYKGRNASMKVLQKRQRAQPTLKPFYRNNSNTTIGANSS